MPDLPGSRSRRIRGAPLPGMADLAGFVRELRGPTRWSAARALLDGALVVVTLERRGLRPLVAAPEPGARADPERAVRVAAAVDAALGLLPASSSCLRRSVTLLRELRRLRLAATMHIGVRNGPDGLEAHAWIQSGDIVVNDDPTVTDGYGEIAGGDVERLLPLLR